jgi:Ner family transcriptional regulator
MARIDIVVAIKKAGLSLEKLALNNDLSKAAVSVCLRKPWPKVEQIIAETIGVQAHLIWPSRYDRPGVPIKRGGTKESKRPKRASPTGRSRCGSNKTRRAA